MQQYLVLAPEALLVIAALVALFSEFLGGDRAAAAVGTVASAAAAVLVWALPSQAGELFGGMLTYGGSAEMMVRSSIAAFTALFMLWVLARGWAGAHAREGVSMALFAIVGGMLLVAVRDVLMLFIALELATLPAYVMIGYTRGDRRSLEGALKYFLMSMLSSLVMAYGFSYLFGMAGSTRYVEIAGSLDTAPRLAFVASVLVLVGLFTKITAAPFQFWAPDAYEGANVPAVAFVASIAKVGPLWALVYFTAGVMPVVENLNLVVLGVAVLSMIVGNMVALIQSDVRRMMAYSGVANAGYMLLGVASASAIGFASATYFVVVYVVSVLGLMLTVAQEGPTLADIAGLVKRRPVAAWCTIGFLFSLIGFPPMVGFYGKLAVFSSALHAGHLWAVVIAVLMSAVSAGYAFKLIRAMFTPGESAPEMLDVPLMEQRVSYPQIPALASAVIVILAVGTVALGIGTESILKAFEIALSWPAA